MIDVTALTYPRYYTARIAAMASECAVTKREARDCYPSLMQEYEGALWDAASRDKVIAPQVLDRLRPEFVHSLRTQSRGAAIPAGWLPPQIRKQLRKQIRA